MTMWDDVKRNLLGLYDTASDKTGEVARIGVKRYDIFGISRDIERLFGEIGSLVYVAAKEGRDDVMQDEALQAIFTRIGLLENDLKDKEKEIANIKATKAAAREAARRQASGSRPDGSAAGLDLDLDLDGDPESDAKGSPRTGG